MAQRFSQRLGITPSEPALQLEEMSIDLRNSLWNILLQWVDPTDDWFPLATKVAADFAKVSIDTLPEYGFLRRDWIKQIFFKLPWYGAYDFIEFIVHEAWSIFTRKKEVLITHFNQILEREGSGYRFIGGVLSPISSKAEMMGIEEALMRTGAVGFSGAHEHLATALMLLGKRPTPDYRNSIKESISAVESAVKLITGVHSGGLSVALETVAREARIHPALKSALKSLYGYTSDDSGIRHALLDDPNVGFDEAKFMLVSCSAFLNFLLAKADQAKLLNTA